MLELVVAIFIAGTAMVFILSLGRANVQMSQLNQAGLMARQVAMDALDYYSRNLPEARWQAQANPQIESVYPAHAAFRDALKVSPEAEALFKSLEPRLRLEVDPSPSLAPGGETSYPGLVRLTCSITWKEGRGRDAERIVSFSKLVSETP